MSPKISESELVVMEVLWETAPLASDEVVKRLADTGWNEKTVKTFLNRLVKKQALSYQRDGRRYLYSPCIARESVLELESRGFLNSVFKGDIKALLATFVRDKQLSQEELHYLRSLLDDQSKADAKPRSRGDK